MDDAINLFDSVLLLQLNHDDTVNFLQAMSTSRVVSLGFEKREYTLAPISLANIYSFHQALTTIVEETLDKEIAIVIDFDPKEVTTAALLFGSHMIISRGMSTDEVIHIFQPIYPRFAELTSGYNEENHNDISVEDCWRAVHRATLLGWANFNPPNNADGQELIDMDEYLHYDDTPNGAMHLVDPSRLLLFREPADLPAGVSWEDEGGRRRFGAEHYAGLFEDFGVQLVVRCGGGPWDSAALRSAGMEVEELRVEADGEGMLAAVDRFLTLARLVPGCIAVQCGVGGDDDDDRDEDCKHEADTAARLLVAAQLIRQRGFTAAGAVAWTWIAHPAAAARPAAALALLA
jgi:hypothetical protein